MSMLFYFMLGAGQIHRLAFRKKTEKHTNHNKTPVDAERGDLRSVGSAVSSRRRLVGSRRRRVATRDVEVELELLGAPVEARPFFMRCALMTCARTRVTRGVRGAWCNLPPPPPPTPHRVRAFERRASAAAAATRACPGGTDIGDDARDAR